MKDSREVNIMFNKNGSGNVTTRVSLPVPWVKELGFTEEDRQATIEICDDKIILKKK